MMTTDSCFDRSPRGRCRGEAAALAHTIFFFIFTFGMGLVSAVAPLAAQAFGARNPRLVRARFASGCGPRW